MPSRSASPLLAPDDERAHHSLMDDTPADDFKGRIDRAKRFATFWAAIYLIGAVVIVAVLLK